MQIDTILEQKYVHGIQIGKIFVQIGVMDVVIQEQKHGDAVLSKMEMKKFKKGDTVINDWADATEVKRWKMSEKDEAIAELASKKCTYKKGIELTYIDEWALEYCECDEDGEFVEGSDYDMADEEIDDEE